MALQLFRHTGYMDYQTRFRSLEKWPLRNLIDIEELARAGYFYPYLEECSEALCCAYCNVLQHIWVFGDDAWHEHISSSPRCIHMLATIGKEQIVRILEQKSENFYTLPQDIAVYVSQRHKDSCYPQVFGQEGPLMRTAQNGIIQSHGACETPVYTTLGGKKFEEPKVPTFSDHAVRENTFDRMDASIRARSGALAQTGLFYNDGTGGLQCYYCGVHFDLSMFPPDADPCEIHAQNSVCFHIILTKGESFLDGVRNRASANAPSCPTGEQVVEDAEGGGHHEPQVTAKRSREEEDDDEEEEEGEERRYKRSREHRGIPDSAPGTSGIGRRDGGLHGANEGDDVCRTCNARVNRPFINLRIRHAKISTCEACVRRETSP